MPTHKPMPDLDALRAVTRINPQNGQFTRLRKNGRWTPGAKGQTFSFNKVCYVANRIAYYLYHGEDPGPLVVDHIDGNRSNNAKYNLRAVTTSVNNQNRATTAASGHKGVYALGREGGYYVQYCRVVGTGEVGAKMSRDGYRRKTVTLGKFPCLCTAKDAFINYVYSEGLEGVQRAEAITPIPAGECPCSKQPAFADPNDLKPAPVVSITLPTLPDNPNDLKPGDCWLNDMLMGGAK